MRICVVGAAGREHALAAALSRTADVVVVPGNPGIALLGAGSAAGGGAISCRPDPPESIEADLYVVGPEQPLVDGLADRLRGMGRLVFGPGAGGARLEGSKAWMKELLVAAGVPTAAHGAFHDVEPAIAMLRRLSPPYVVKTDGLAAGKGVLVTASLAEAEDDVRSKLDGSAFGQAGRRVVIEEGLDGEELSVMAVCDGARAVPLDPAQDFKRAGDGDVGPNTGGMGAYSPVAAGSSLVDTVMDVAVEPTLRELRRRGIDYRGVLYAGVMLTAEGPKVLEYNVRFGDPETQVVLPRWRGDVGAVLAAAAGGDLRAAPAPTFIDDAAVCVVLAAEGYPLANRSGDEIAGAVEAAGLPGVQVFAAGVAAGDRGQLVTAGGRVLGVTAVGATVPEARDRVYAAVGAISWEGMQYRSDIAGGQRPTRTTSSPAVAPTGPVPGVRS